MLSFSSYNRAVEIYGKGRRNITTPVFMIKKGGQLDKISWKNERVTEKNLSSRSQHLASHYGQKNSLVFDLVDDS